MAETGNHLGADALKAYAKEHQAPQDPAGAAMFAVEAARAESFPMPRATFREANLMRNLANDRPLLYAEGDSWFDFPSLLVPGPNSDIIDALVSQHDYAVIRRSDKGDTLSNMRMPENLQLLAAELQRDRPMAFLLSGGGNDLFGGGKECRSTLHELLRSKRMTDPEGPIDLARLHATVDQLLSHIRLIVQPALRLGIPVLLHGYAAPVKRVIGTPACWGFAGPWIEPVLQCRGYDPPNEGPTILKHIVDQFNERLADYVNSSNLLHYVNLREVVETNHWRDELHLKAEGWVAVANAFHQRLQTVAT